MVAAFTKAKALPFLSDKGLHVFFCGTGSPMPDLTRAGACLAIIAGGRVVVIDAGPGSYAKLAASGIPPARLDTVLLTHLHSDHIGDLGELATQSWLGGGPCPSTSMGRRRRLPPRP